MNMNNESLKYIRKTEINSSLVMWNSLIWGHKVCNPVDNYWQYLSPRVAWIQMHSAASFFFSTARYYRCTSPRMIHLYGVHSGSIEFSNFVYLEGLDTIFHLYGGRTSRFFKNHEGNPISPLAKNPHRKTPLPNCTPERMHFVALKNMGCKYSQIEVDGSSIYTSNTGLGGINLLEILKFRDTQRKVDWSSLKNWN